jgi:hypothetical protein
MSLINKMRVGRLKGEKERGEYIGLSKMHANRVLLFCRGIISSDSCHSNLEKKKILSNCLPEKRELNQERRNVLGCIGPARFITKK